MQEDGADVLKRNAVVLGLLVLVAVAFLVVVWLMPPTQADLFDSPLPTPYAYLPFVAARGSFPPPPCCWVYVPAVFRGAEARR
jgi:hypothetical protein